MVRIRDQLMDPYTEVRTVYMSFSRVVCWLLDVHFIVDTACLVQKFIFAEILIIDLTESGMGYDKGIFSIS